MPDAQLRFSGDIGDDDAHRIRCTNLTQLPLVFSAGSSEKLEADAGADAVDGAGPALARIVSTSTVTFCPA